MKCAKCGKEIRLRQHKVVQFVYRTICRNEITDALRYEPYRYEPNVYVPERCIKTVCGKCFKEIKLKGGD